VLSGLFHIRVFAEVYAVARKVPPGRVTTYGAIARALGLPNGARQVGWAMAICPDDVPAHRVINASGRLSGTEQGVALRRALLEDEGVRFSAAGSISLRRYLWEP
jgi:methylated-DNA-protein-cysteine methyltransferase related protein